MPLDLTSNQEILDTLRDQMPEGYSQRTSLDLALRRAAGLAVGMDVSPTAKPARARGHLPVKRFAEHFHTLRVGGGTDPHRTPNSADQISAPVY